MRLRISKKLIYGLFLVLVFTAPACQTTEKRVVANLNIEEEKRIREWEEYMNFIGEHDLSIGTVLRFTEDYLQAKDVLFKRDTEEYEKQLTLFQKGQLQTPPREPVQDYSMLISRLKTIATHYRYGKGADAIQYIIGYALYEQGKREEAAKAFEELVKTYPRSEYFTEVSFRLGEFYYETGQMGEALEAYKKVLSQRQSLFYEKALYKIAWIQYRLDDFAKSADSFLLLVDMKWSADGKQDGLTEEALSCAVMDLAHFKETREAINLLKARMGKGYISSLMQHFGEKLVEETRYESAILVYRTMEELFPESPDLPFVHERLAYIYDRMGDEERGLAADWDSIHKFNPSAAWYRKNQERGLARIDDLISKKTLSVSRKYHIRGKKEAVAKDIDRAIEGYRLFISSYPSSPEIKKIYLLLGEALFDSGRYAEAAEAYLKTAALYPHGAERGDIAHSTLLAYEVIFYQSDKGGKEAIAAVEELVKRYGSDLEKNGKLEAATYKLADMYSQAGEYKLARNAIAPLLKAKDPSGAYLKTAELYLKERNISAAEEIYSGLVEKQGTPAMKETLAGLRYSLAEEHAAAGRTKEAVSRFNQVFSLLPGSKIGESALLKVGSLHLKRMEIEPLEDIFGRLVKNYPDSKEVLPLMVATGRGIENMEPLRAARVYEGALPVARDRDASLKLMLAAAMLYETGKDYQKAESLFIRYIDEGKPTGAGLAEGRLRLGGVQMKMGRKKEGIENLSRVIQSEGKIEDALVGKARLLLLEEKEAAYLGAKLTQPFEETLQKKMALLDGLLKDYSQIAKYKVPELLPEIFFKMGTALENFKDSMIQSERPAGMPKQELEEYSFLLEERAYPYEEQSVRAFEKGLTGGTRNGLNNEWVDKCLTRLAALRPALYKRVMAGKGPDPVFIPSQPVKLEKGL